MRTGFKIFLGTAGSWMPFRFLVRLSGQNLVFPFYHVVSDDPVPHAGYVYPVRSVRQFSRDLEFLLRHFEPVGLEAFAGTPGKRSRPAMFLSFDDGLSEVHGIVAPILHSKGIPAAVFVNTDFIGNRELFYRYKISLLLDRLEKIRYSPAVTELLQSRYHLVGATRKCVRDFLLGISYRNRGELDRIAALVDVDFHTFLRVRKPYMSLEQLKELSGKGFYIGAHSMDHPRFSELDPEERLLQYRGSMEYIRRELGTGYGIFSFPFTDDGVPFEFFERISAGDMPRLDASFGAAGLKRDPLAFHHQRIPMEAGRAGAGRLLRGEYLYFLLRGLAGRNQIRRK